MPGQNVSGASNDFISTFTSSFGSAVGETVGLLPRWAANQLQLESSNQLFQPQFDQRFQENRLTQDRLAQRANDVKKPPTVQSAGFPVDSEFGNILIFGGLILIGVFLVAKG